MSARRLSNYHRFQLFSIQTGKLTFYVFTHGW